MGRKKFRKEVRAAAARAAVNEKKSGDESSSGSDSDSDGGLLYQEKNQKILDIINNNQIFVFKQMLDDGINIFTAITFKRCEGVEHDSFRECVILSQECPIGRNLELDSDTFMKKTRINVESMSEICATDDYDTSYDDYVKAKEDAISKMREKSDEKERHREDVVYPNFSLYSHLEGIQRTNAYVAQMIREYDDDECPIEEYLLTSEVNEEIYSYFVAKEQKFFEDHKKEDMELAPFAEYCKASYPRGGFHIDKYVSFHLLKSGGEPMKDYLDSYAMKSKRIIKETEEQFDCSSVLQHALETEYISDANDDSCSDEDDRYVDPESSPVHTVNETKNHKKLVKQIERARRMKNSWMDQWDDKDDIDWALFDTGVLYENDPQRKYFGWVINGITKNLVKDKDMYTVYYCDPKNAGTIVPVEMGYHSKVFTLSRLLVCNDISTAFFNAIDSADYGENVAAIGARMCKLSNTQKLQTRYGTYVKPFGFRILPRLHDMEKYCCISAVLHTIPFIIKWTFRDSQMMNQILDNAIHAHRHYNNGANIALSNLTKVMNTINKGADGRMDVYHFGKMMTKKMRKPNTFKVSEDSNYTPPLTKAWQIEDLLSLDEDSAFVLQVIERNNSINHMVAYVIEHKFHYIVDNSIGFFVRATKKSFNELGFIGIKNCHQVIWQKKKIDLPPFEESDDEFDSKSSDAKPSPEPSPKRQKVEESDDVVPGTCDDTDEVEEDNEVEEESQEEESQVHNICE
uniref:Uncharacterized protein n=1 Tax=Corethron hystrix TaxID=216773 RepID=A0A7S1BNP5_9STRA|mmetsp:Transcript_32939/g.75850  ORF Transcript_32939/g.75850 Transcript_32939/m.75850 type:complete len:743 (+) Transcript_32939:54-2282(+)